MNLFCYIAYYIIYCSVLFNCIYLNSNVKLNATVLLEL